MNAEPKPAGGILDPRDIADRFFAPIERGDLDAAAELCTLAITPWPG
jgi:hypothetical protein